MGDNLLGLGVNALANEFEMERLRMRQENQPQQPHQPGIDFGGMGSGMSGGSGMGGSRYDPPSSASTLCRLTWCSRRPLRRVRPGTAAPPPPAPTAPARRRPPPPTVPPPPAVPTPPAVGITAPSFDHQSDEALLDTSLGSSLDALGSSLERAMFGSPRGRPPTMSASAAEWQEEEGQTRTKRSGGRSGEETAEEASQGEACRGSILRLAAPSAAERSCPVAAPAPLEERVAAPAPSGVGCRPPPRWRCRPRRAHLARCGAPRLRMAPAMVSRAACISNGRSGDGMYNGMDEQVD